MTKKIAIIQSNYIPWKGYFDFINMVDEFVLFDDVQYTIRDWRNRNMIMTKDGPKWLTIPVQVKGKYHQKIKDVVISDAGWNVKHWNTIAHCYGKARHFADYRGILEPLYLECAEERLSAVNRRFIDAVCSMLGIKTKITWSMDYPDPDKTKTERLLDICKKAGASHYISGPAAKSYIDEGLFKDACVELSYMDYSGYPEYRQLYSPFSHSVSILDLLLNEGPEAKKYMKSFGA